MAHPTPIGLPAVRPSGLEPDAPNRVSHELPAHLRAWELPPEWAWGREGVYMEYRHYQEVRDALGRSLSLVSAPDPAHVGWLSREARHLAHRNHPAIPTTYHFWAPFGQTVRGPGYLRRWIASETVGARTRRAGADDIPGVMRLVRAVGSTLAYLHDTGQAHGSVSPEVVWYSPSGRYWMLGWQWAVPRADIPEGLHPDFRWTPRPPEWDAGWAPTPASDQWQLAATCYAALTGELPPTHGAPPVRLVRTDCPQALASILDTAMAVDPAQRHRSVSYMLRALERVSGTRTMLVSASDLPSAQGEEGRLRWAVGDDYEILGFLGRGTFGSVWRARDLSLEREVALKMLHPTVAEDEQVVARFRREARLAAMLAHPAIIPIFDWDARGDVSWYTMELAEGGSIADLLARSGVRPFEEIAPQVTNVLDALTAAHANGILHRDLKPENILIDRYRRWRITDFGIAMGEDEAAGASGTPAFAAPEQLLGEPQGPAVDCFAVAAIIYFALSGVPPFDAGDAPSRLAQQLGGRYEDGHLPPAVAAFVRRGMAPDPADRFADAGEMLAAWHEVVDEQEREARRGDSWWERVLG